MQNATKDQITQASEIAHKLCEGKPDYIWGATMRGALFAIVRSSDSKIGLASEASDVMVQP